MEASGAERISVGTPSRGSYYAPSCLASLTGEGTITRQFGFGGKQVANGGGSRGWFAEHWVDLLTVLLTGLGLWIGYKIPLSLNEQDSAERLKAERSARFEADLGQINQLVSGVLGEDGAEHVVGKRSAARAVSEYAQQGRVYTPATSILLHYLEKEGDPKAHCYLRAAIDRGLTVKPPALGAGARSVDGGSLDESGWATTITVERARLMAFTRPTDTGDCSTITEAGHEIPPTQPKVSEFRQYLDVDCNRVNASSELRVAIDSGLASQFRVQSATATIQDSSNLKEAQADVLRTEPEAAFVRYSITGLDRQFLGNCPGGGHGTLVVRFQLAPK